MTDKITLELTLDELKTLDKNLYYCEETWSIFDKIKVAFPQPQMNLQQEGDYVSVSYNNTTYYRLMGETTYTWYIKVTQPVPNLVMVDDAETERLLDGLYYNHIVVKRETAQERVHNEMEETIKIHDGYGVVDYQPTPQTPAEEAYKRWMDVYPPTGPSVNAIDLFRWRAFQRGYDAAYQEPEDTVWKSVALKLGESLSDVGPDGYYEFSADEWFEWAIDECLTNEVKRLQEKNRNVVRESVKWCEENPDKDPLDWLKPQTPEQVADGLKEAFREAVKQGVVSSTKRQTLTDLIYDWWGDVFTANSDWDMETSIENLVDEISLWLPTEHETNSYKWNECIRMIREKLR
jgi:hypothetical protein